MVLTIYCTADYIQCSVQCGYIWIGRFILNIFRDTTHSLQCRHVKFLVIALCLRGIYLVHVCMQSVCILSSAVNLKTVMAHDCAMVSVGIEVELLHTMHASVVHVPRIISCCLLYMYSRS